MARHRKPARLNAAQRAPQAIIEWPVLGSYGFALERHLSRGGLLESLPIITIMVKDLGVARVLSVHEKGALARPSMPCRAKPRLRPVTFTKCSMPAADSLTATGAVVLGRPTATARRLVNASLSDNTRRAYAGALGQIDAWLDGRRLDDAALAAYLAELHDAGCKPPDRCRYVLPEETICPERPPRHGGAAMCA